MRLKFNTKALDIHGRFGGNTVNGKTFASSLMRLDRGNVRNAQQFLQYIHMYLHLADEIRVFSSWMSLVTQPVTVSIETRLLTQRPHAAFLSLSVAAPNVSGS